MTALVHHPGYPDRLACEKCGCEVAARRDGEAWRTALTERGGGPMEGWTHLLHVDEPPVHLDLTDGCPCHDTYNQLVSGNRYDHG